MGRDKTARAARRVSQSKTSVPEAPSPGQGVTSENLDRRTVESFGREWARFRYGGETGRNVGALYATYFGWLAEDLLSADFTGADFGCGSGRWATLVAPQVRELWCIDASSEALDVARGNLSPLGNCRFLQEPIGELTIPDGTFDFGYCLGVLHHVPDTAKGLNDCVRTLKRGAPLLLYLYYALDNRPAWYRLLWRTSNLLRRCISALPHPLKVATCETIAALVYWPLARSAYLGEKLGCNVKNWPLSFYRAAAFYVLRNDALDRFGTRLEKRFTRQQIKELMEGSGLGAVRFSENPPFWVAVGYKA